MIIELFAIIPKNGDPYAWISSLITLVPLREGWDRDPHSPRKLLPLDSALPIVARGHSIEETAKVFLNEVKKRKDRIITEARCKLQEHWPAILSDNGVDVDCPLILTFEDWRERPYEILDER